MDALMNRILPNLFLSTALSACLIFNAFPGYPAEDNLQKASFISQWVPQSQFAGYYLAHEKGFYKNYGIDVEIGNGGPQISPCELLKKKEADFINISLNTAIEERAKGLKLVNIAQLVQDSAMMLVAKKSSGIERIEDINNRKVGVWRGISQIQAQSFLKKYSLDVKVVPQSYSVDLFLRGGIDAASAMWYNEYHTILNSGYDPDELTTFFFSEHGLNFPEDGIYTLEETFRDRPDFCCAFVKASLEGWMYAFEHPEEALDIVLKYAKQANVPANRVHQKWMLERMQDLIIADGREIGVLRPEDYNQVAEALKDAGIITEITPFDIFCKDCGTYYDKE